MKFMYFSIKYRYNDSLLKKRKLHYNHLFCCNHSCYRVGIVSVMSASSDQSGSSMYIPGLIPRNYKDLAEFRFYLKSKISNNFQSKFWSSGLLLGDNGSQNFHLGRYIVGNLVLQQCSSGAIKRDFRL